MKLKKLEIANAIMPTTVLYSTLSGSRLFRHFPGWPYLLLILLVAPILALWTITWPNIHQTTSGLYETSAPKTSLLTQQNCASIESAIANATRYLLDHRNPVQGYFSYVIQPDGTEISNDYNILRHAGVMYALAMRYERKPSPEIREVCFSESIFEFSCIISYLGELNRLENILVRLLTKPSSTSVSTYLPLAKTRQNNQVAAFTPFGIIPHFLLLPTKSQTGISTSPLRSPSSVALASALSPTHTSHAL